MSVAEVAAIAPLGMTEVIQGMLARSGGTLSGLRAEADRLRGPRDLPGASARAQRAAIEAVARQVSAGPRTEGTEESGDA